MSSINRRPWCGPVYSVLAGLLAAAFFGAQPEAGQYEQPPSFQASQVLPPNLLKSPYYTVGTSVGLDNFQYVFRVDSKWGPFTVKAPT